MLGSLTLHIVEIFGEKNPIYIGYQYNNNTNPAKKEPALRFGQFGSRLVYQGKFNSKFVLCMRI